MSQLLVGVIAKTWHTKLKHTQIFWFLFHFWIESLAETERSNETDTKTHTETKISAETVTENFQSLGIIYK